MSRIHAMGRVVYWSAGALVVLNCVPHTLPGILKKRCALHCSQLHTLTHYTLSHNAHSHTAHYLHNAHTHSYELKDKTPPEELVAHVRRIAAAMVRTFLTSSGSGTSCHSPFPIYTLSPFTHSHCPTLSTSESSSPKASVVSELVLPLVASPLTSSSSPHDFSPHVFLLPS